MSGAATTQHQAAAHGQSTGFRPDIEGLRGIAVLIVVAFHCGIPGFSGGFVGVDVFFALSGYLISGLLINEVEKTSHVRLLHFYARRARRLLPASALVVAATLGAGAILFAPQELLFAARAARATALYISNVFFAINAADYFAPGVETNPMLHTWSLAVEEQFYLFWPFLIVLGLQVWKSRRGLIALLSGLTFISFVFCIWLTKRGGPFAFYSLPARAWEFGIGGLAAMIPLGLFRRVSAGWLGLGGIGIAAVLGSASLVSAAQGFPGWVAAVPVVGTVVVLVAGAEWRRTGRQAVGAGRIGPEALLSSAPLQFLGKMSYSWYLWHWPFLVFAAALVPNVGTAGRSVAAVASLGAALFAYAVVENPIRFHPRLVGHPAVTLALAAVIMVCSVASSVAAIRVARALGRAPELRAVTTAVDDIAAMQRERCVTLAESAAVRTCTFGDPVAAITVVLFGDSHAIQWFNALKEIAHARGWRLLTVLKSGCPAFYVAPLEGGEAAARNCNEWHAAAMRLIVGLRPSLVIAGSATTYLDLKRAGRPELDLQQWREGARRTFLFLSRAGIPVAAMRDTPRPNFEVPTCLARLVRHGWYPGGNCEFRRSSALRPAAFAAETSAADGLGDIHFVDMTEEFCDSRVCWAMKDGMVVYRDDNHLTGTYTARLAPVLESKLIALIKTH